MNKSAKIYIAGHTGMVGSAIHRRLTAAGYANILTRTSRELDLRHQDKVRAFFMSEKPEFVILAAAKVGGIMANHTYRAEFIYDNIMIQANCIDAAYRSSVQKLLFLGSSCIYPRDSPQPIREEYFLTGQLEPTNAPYAIAKISGIAMCDAYRAQYGCHFISAMPTNLYGPNDNYDLESSHVLPALMRKFIEARRSNADSVTLWGSGTPRREFLHVDDLADACIFLMRYFDEPGFVNVGTGEDLTIRALAELIRDITGYRGEIIYDTTKPDGTPRKLLDISKISALGWSPHITLEEGLRRTYEEIRDVVW